MERKQNEKNRISHLGAKLDKGVRTRPEIRISITGSNNFHFPIPILKISPQTAIRPCGNGELKYPKNVWTKNPTPLKASLEAELRIQGTNILI